MGPRCAERLSHGGGSERGKQGLSQDHAAEGRLPLHPLALPPGAGPCPHSTPRAAESEYATHWCPQGLSQGLRGSQGEGRSLCLPVLGTAGPVPRCWHRPLAAPIHACWGNQGWWELEQGPCPTWCRGATLVDLARPCSLGGVHCRNDGDTVGVLSAAGAVSQPDWMCPRGHGQSDLRKAGLDASGPALAAQVPGVVGGEAEEPEGKAPRAQAAHAPPLWPAAGRQQAGRPHPQAPKGAAREAPSRPGRDRGTGPCGCSHLPPLASGSFSLAGTGPCRPGAVE